VQLLGLDTFAGSRIDATLPLTTPNAFGLVRGRFAVLHQGACRVGPDEKPQLVSTPSRLMTRRTLHRTHRWGYTCAGLLPDNADPP